MIRRSVNRRNKILVNLSMRLKAWAANKISLSNILSILDVLESGSSVLIIGGATIGDSISSLYSFQKSLELKIVSVDIYASSHVDVLADAHYLPFQSSSFDLVIIQAVLEHVISPHTVIKEISRVLCPSGLVYSEAPFLQSVHEGPYDFFRFTLSAHRWLFGQYSEIRSGVLQGTIESLLFIMQSLLASYVPKTIASSLFYILVPIARAIDGMLPRKCNLNNCSATYFLGRKSLDVFRATSVIDYYNSFV